MIEANIDARLIKVCGMGLTKEHLGMSVREMEPTFVKLNEQCGFHICGEGGEFETATLNCPLFKKRIEIEEMEVIEVETNPIAPVAHLNLKKLFLIDKTPEEIESDIKILTDMKA